MCLVLAAGCGEADKSSGTDSDSSGDTADTDAQVTTGPTSSSTESDACAGDPPAITVTNGTLWTLTALQFAACDTPDVVETFPFPGGLEPDKSFDVSLPAAGCYVLGIVEPSGCLLIEPVQTEELAACGTFALELSEDLFECPGGAR